MEQAPPRLAIFLQQQEQELLQSKSSNSHAHFFVKEYFDKPFRMKSDVAHKPRRQLDPYEENEVKGTRMPDWSKVSVERDLFGELGWIPNFNVKKSKNNPDLHNNYREFFDAPKDYNVEFQHHSKNSLELLEKFSQHEMSVSQQKSEGSRSRSREGSPRNNETSFAQTRRSLNAVERMSYSQVRER